MKDKFKSKLTEFSEFIREQGVIGLAIGFILGAQIKEVVSAIVSDFIGPFLGLILGNANGLAYATFSIGDATFLYGHFLSTLIDFIIIAAVIFYGVKGLGLDKLDRKKE